MPTPSKFSSQSAHAAPNSCIREAQPSSSDLTVCAVRGLLCRQALCPQTGHVEYCQCNRCYRRYAAVAVLPDNVQETSLFQRFSHSSSSSTAGELPSCQAQDTQSSSCQVAHTTDTTELSPGHSCSSSIALHLAHWVQYAFPKPPLRESSLEVTGYQLA